MEINGQWRGPCQLVQLCSRLRHAVHQDSELVHCTGGDVLCVSQAVPPIRGQLSTAVWARFNGVIICSIQRELRRKLPSRHSYGASSTPRLDRICPDHVDSTQWWVGRLVRPPGQPRGMMLWLAVPDSSRRSFLPSGQLWAREEIRDSGSQSLVAPVIHL